MMALVLLGAAGAARATVFDWDDYSGDRSFQTRLEWNSWPDSANVPGPGDTAVFDGILAGMRVGENTVNVASATVIDAMRVIDAAIVDLTIGDGTAASRFVLERWYDYSLVVDTNISEIYCPKSPTWLRPPF